MSEGHSEYISKLLSINLSYYPATGSSRAYSLPADEDFSGSGSDYGVGVDGEEEAESESGESEVEVEDSPERVVKKKPKVSFTVIFFFLLSLRFSSDCAWDIPTRSHSNSTGNKPKSWDCRPLGFGGEKKENC